MNKSKRTYRSQAQWQDLVTEQANSDLSPKDFCAAKDLSYSGFCNWRRRFDDKHEQAPLIDLSALMDAPDHSAWLIELDLGNGVKLNLRQS